MSLFKIAQKNIRKNFSHYLLYFASMIFSIVIYFTFVSLKYDETIQENIESSLRINSMFNAASVVLVIFAAVFIWYSNSFFMRKRKKEIGLYALLGVRKKQIGWMLFYENAMMGLLALLVGILIGALFSKFFVWILMKAMGYAALSHFAISLSAVANTFIVFTLITAFTSFQGYRLIYRFKLIELFHAEKESEKEPHASLLLAFLSLILIGAGYWLALQNMMESEVWAKIGILMTPLVILTAVVLGTFLLFNTFTVFLLKLSRKNKKHFWNGIHIISISQLLYRMKGNARTLTTIAVLSAATLSAVGASYSLYYNNKTNAQLANPYSVMFAGQGSTYTEEAEKEMKEAEDQKILSHTSVSAVPLIVDTTNLDSRMGPLEMMYTFISSTASNEMAEEQKREERVDLKGNEAAVLDAGYYEGLSSPYIGLSLPIETNNFEETITFTQLMKYNVLNLQNAPITVVVSDELFSQLEANAEPVRLEAYQLSNQEKMADLNKKLENLLPEEARYSSFYHNYAAGMEKNGVIIFIGGFLGLVFLAAAGSIIYFKQLTEASADKERYLILRNIGVNKKEIRKAISQQVFFVFALPLAAGITHSLVALTALSNLMQTNLAVPVGISITVYTLMYIGYYFLTVRNYYKIVTE